MRIRTIKPEFYASFNIAKLSEPAVILAIGLLNHSCDRGFFEADPRIIKASIFPLREPSRSIPGMLGELSGIGFVALRNAQDGRLVGHVVNFLDHQRIEKPAKTISRAQRDFETGSPANEFCEKTEAQETLFPEPSRNTPVVLPEPSGKKGAGTGNREQGREQGNNLAAAPQPRARNELFDAIVEVTGQNPQVCGGEIGKAIAAIKSLTPTVTPADIKTRAANYALHFKDASLSASALAKWWTKCAAPPDKPDGNERRMSFA